MFGKQRQNEWREVARVQQAIRARQQAGDSDGQPPSPASCARQYPPQDWEEDDRADAAALGRAAGELVYTLCTRPGLTQGEVASMLPVSGPGSGCRSLPLAWARRSGGGSEQMGAKDWLLMYADGEIQPVLRSAPVLDRQATRALVRRLYPRHELSDLPDGTLLEQANPDDDRVYAGCFAGLTVVRTTEAALDRPSRLDLREARGSRLYLHAMHSVVDWFAYAIWSADGALVQALSLDPPRK
jgi:hypothetical protein